MPMMQAVCSMSALEDRPAALMDSTSPTTTTTRSSSSGSSPHDKQSAFAPQPFFIMDWLEELAADQDLEQISKLLKTPSKKDRANNNNNNNKNQNGVRRMEHRDDEHHPHPLSPPRSGTNDYGIMPHESSTTTTTTTITYSSDPTTPKSSNRKNKNVASSLFPTSVSCPTLLPGDRSRSPSPIRPKQLLFGSGGRWGQKSESESGTAATTATGSTSTSTMPPPPTIVRRRGRQPRSPHSIYRKSIALGNAWNAKGLSKAQQGLWQEALGCWDNSLEIRIQLLGRQHLDVANTLNNRGIGLGKLGQYKEALESLEQALQIRWHLWEQQQHQQQQQQQQQQQADPVTVIPAPAASTDMNKKANNKATTTTTTTTTIEPILSTLHNIANVHQQAGDLNEALVVFGRARDLGSQQEATPATTATATVTIPLARICVAMGHVYYQVEQWVDARDAYQDAAGLYRAERKRQQQQMNNRRNSSSSYHLMDDEDDDDDDDEDAAILMCQQELTDVERDLCELNHRLFVHNSSSSSSKHHYNYYHYNPATVGGGVGGGRCSSNHTVNLFLRPPKSPAGGGSAARCAYLAQHAQHHS